MNEELKKALDELATKLEGKSKDATAQAVKDFETKYADLIAVEQKKNEDDLAEMKEEMIKDFDVKLKIVQDHADKLDVRLQGKTVNKENVDQLKKLITDNFDQIKTVRVGASVKVDTKAVANMTLGTALTGDQPRDYNFNVVTIPGQLLNVSDIVGMVNITGGTYTFPRETGGEGAIAVQTEGNDKAQVDYDLAMIDVNTDFIAGFAVYSKKMANNLPFLESWLPSALRRDYAIAENTVFNTELASEATASSQIITGQNKVEMLIAEISTLEEANFGANGIVVKPSDFWDILITEKSTGAGYGLPGVVSLDGGQLRINGIPIYRANWVATNKYYVGDWSRINKIVTEGLSLDFSEHDEDNFRKNNITARIESQVALAVEQPTAIIIGDFTAT